MNKQQVKWASLHDWFNSAQEDAKGYYVICNDYQLKNGKWKRELVKFDNFKKLKEWAGY